MGAELIVKGFNASRHIEVINSTTSARSPPDVSPKRYADSSRPCIEGGTNALVGDRTQSTAAG